MEKTAPKKARVVARKEGRALNKQVTFKLDSDRLDKLVNVAKVDGMSHHERARRIVEASIDGDRQELEALRVEVRELGELLKKQRDGMIGIFTTLLTLLPEPDPNDTALNARRLSVKEAKEFVRVALEEGKV